MSEVAQGQRDVLTHFRRVSTDWNARYDCAPRRMSDLDLQLRRAAAVDLLRPQVEGELEPMPLLDVGCGSGSLLELLASQSLRLHGIDPVPEMIYEARQRVPDADLRESQASQLPWPEASMRFVTCLGVLEYLEDPEAALAEMYRVLQPGGALIVTFPNRLSFFRKLSRWEIAIESAAAKTLNKIRGRTGDTGLYRPYVHRDRSVAEAQRLLRAAGFVVQRLRGHTYGLWGHLGRSRTAISMSRGLSHCFATAGWPARYLACTLVFLARKPGPPGKDSAP